MSTTASTAPECCPFCGAARRATIGFRWFECGTMTAPADDNRRGQTPTCATAERERLTRERDEAREERDDSREAFGNMKRSYEESVSANINALNQIGDLCMENANLLARVKRLEEAGDVMQRKARPFFVRSVCIDGDPDTEMSIREIDPGHCIHHEEPPTAGEMCELADAVDGWTKAKEATP